MVDIDPLTGAPITKKSFTVESPPKNESKSVESNKVQKTVDAIPETDSGLKFRVKEVIESNKSGPINTKLNTMIRIRTILKDGGMDSQMVERSLKQIQEVLNDE